MDNLIHKLTETLNNHLNIKQDLSRSDLIQASYNNRETVITTNGALATWTTPESTGRAPKDTYLVGNPESKHKIDWTSPNNQELSPEIFDLLWQSALDTLLQKKQIYLNNKSIGADSSYALPIQVITNSATSAVFGDNMFRPQPTDINKSIFANQKFTLLVLPNNKIPKDIYLGKINSNKVIAIDFDRHLGLVYGSAYCGSVKKLLFTAMNYYLPDHGILPLHCSANVGSNNQSALFLGLSGTGKTTLSADPNRALIGDDEHGWNDNGIANFENGCYAKLVALDPEKEPEIYQATFGQKPYLEHGSLIENALVYPDGHVDVNDTRLTENSRVSYPLTALSNVQTGAKAGHPKTIIFLTADASGILPPVAKLDKAQAMFWFLMGYTSKLAGTETGITKPTATFSRFFGEPFMPRNPSDYTDLFGKQIQNHKTNVYLVNTGWSGGPYGIGQRMDIQVTRAIVTMALNGELANVQYQTDPLFHLSIPQTCPGIESKILNPKNTWANPNDYNLQAHELANKFADKFNSDYKNSNLSAEIKSVCPSC